MLRLQETDDPILPPKINKALSSNALLFIGYSLTDWNFRLILRSFPLSRTITLQLVRKDAKNKLDAAKYLNKYFEKILGGKSKVTVRFYWGDSTEFARDLRKHWSSE